MLPVKSPSVFQISKINFSKIVLGLSSSSFVKNIFVVMTGTVIAQVMGFALAPIISRLYSPADFGVFASFNAVLTVASAGATLQYSQAIMLPKGKDDAINLFFVSSLCTFFVGFLCLVGSLAAPTALNSLMKTEGTWALLLLVLATIVAGLNQSLQAWSVRVKAFKHTSASQIIRSLSSNGTKIGFGYIKGGSQSLIVSIVLADILGSLSLIRVLVLDILKFREFIQWERMKELAMEYRDFPMYSASQNVTNALSSGLPVLLLTYYYGITIAGAYAFGMSILNVPMGFVLGALRQVLFQKAAETQHQDGRLARLYFKTTVGLFVIALMPSLILFIWAPQIFAWIFGSQWHMAGELARSLVIWLAVVFCNLPAVLFARIIRIQRFVFFYDLVLLAARSLTLVMGGLYLTALQTVMFFALVGAAMNGFLIIRVGYAVMRNEGQANFDRLRELLRQG